MPALTLFDTGALAALLQVVLIDIAMAGDNAVVIGMAATRVPPRYRAKVIFWGLAAAVILRIGLAAIAVSLMKRMIGLTLVGGLLLLLVCWHFWRDLRCDRAETCEGKYAGWSDVGAGDERATLRRAILNMTLADISMSLDNVLGVAGAARDHIYILFIGLLLSVGLMGAAASLISRLLQRYRWISYAGLAIVLYVALSMIWTGSRSVLGGL